MNFPTTCRLAKEALVSALRRVPGRREDLLDPGYTTTLRQNVVAAVTDDALAEIDKDLAQGDGAELSRDEQGRAKACAAYSSSALAVNTFGAWRGQRLAVLPLLGRHGFTSLMFEGKFPTGLKGTPPNLDVVLERERELIAIESKCVEYLSPCEPAFRDSYTRRFQELASPAWLGRFEAVCREPRTPSALDMAQLLRHYLGLKHAIAESRRGYEKATLLYLFWEPLNANEYPAFAAHRTAIAEFSAGLDDAHITFAAQSYPELWAEWRAGGPAWAGDLLSQLDQRYSIAIG